jgi:hypothetical protein
VSNPQHTADGVGTGYQASDLSKWVMWQTPKTLPRRQGARGWIALASLTLLGLAWVSHAGVLGSVTVSSNTLVAGSSGVRLTFSMQLASSLPPDGQFALKFPSAYTLAHGYWASSAAAVSANLDGALTVYNNGTVVRVQRSGGSQVRGQSACGSLKPMR